ncbi:MAG: histidine phosphatase family protein [Bacteroidota bacterium]
MSEFILIRHGQASFGKANYDQLSDLGKKQCYKLGIHLATTLNKVDKVYIGELQRHRESAEAILEGFNSQGKSLPEFIKTKNLNEHHGPRVVRKYFDQLKEEDSPEGAYARAFDPSDPVQMNKYFRFFNDITSRWAEGEIDVPEIESWQIFRSKTKKALSQIMENDNGGEHILVVTSGGPVASLCGEALSITEGKIMGLAQLIINASFSRVLRSNDRLSLRSFNEHIFNDEQFITLV